MRTFIKNGLIVDGSGGQGFAADLLVDGGKIAKIGKNLPSDDAEIIDASGLVVAPGFIDTHPHSDLQILLEPTLPAKIRQGITTEVFGQDGISLAPLPIEYISPWRKNLAGLDGNTEKIDWHFKNVDGYFKMIEKVEPAINVCYLVPHGNIRMEAMGLDGRLATPAELEKMREITRREMLAGAVGLSTGLIYMPCAYADTNEVIELCKVVAEFDGVFVIHQRSEADTILESMEEVIQIGRESGVRVHFSHFKVCGRKNWGKVDEIIALLEKAEKEGIQVSFDQYPYPSGSTMMGVILPPWVHDGGTDKLLERLADQSLRQKMVHDIENGIPGWDNFVDFAGVEQIFITSVKSQKNRDAVGLSLAELGKLRGKDPLNAIFDLLLEEENAVGMVNRWGNEETVLRFMQRPEMNVCTDGIVGEKPHPRVFGSFPRVLGKYVREEKILTLEQAVYKMTKKAADTFKLAGRGELKEGFVADICIFNPKTVADKGSFEDPNQPPVGIEFLLVGGQFAIKNAELMGVQSGRVLRLSGESVI